jgi:hypothetical protein
MERAIKDEIALLNQDQNLLYRSLIILLIVDGSALYVKEATFMMLATINNKIAFCENKTGVFHFNVVQQLNKLSYIKMGPSAVRHPVVLLLFSYIFKKVLLLN